MTASRSPFIVFEGLDGAGSTTQLERVGEWLRSHGIEVFETAEPSGSTVGRHIRSRALRSEPWPDQASWAEHMALLFAADRAEHLFGPAGSISLALARGQWVLCDRYLLSSLAYQSTDAVPAEWVLAINRAAGRARPDVTVYVDTPVAICLDRIGHRAATSSAATPSAATASDSEPGNRPTESIFHEGARLEAVAVRYAEFLEQPEITGHLVTVDGSQAIDEVLRCVQAGLRHWDADGSVGVPRAAP